MGSKEGYKLDDSQWKGLTPCDGKENTYLVTAMNGEETPFISSEMVPTAILVPVPEVSNYTYDGNTHTGVTIPSAYQDKIEIVEAESCNEAADAGAYEIKLHLKDTEKYCWDDLTTEDRTVEWTISKASVAVPKPVTGLLYDGSQQTGVDAPDDGTLYTLGGDAIKQTDFGEYTTTATLKNSGNYQWAAGTVPGVTITGDTVKIQWSINRTYRLTVGESAHGSVRSIYGDNVISLDEEAGIYYAQNNAEVSVSVKAEEGYRIDALELSWEDDKGEIQKETLPRWEEGTASNDVNAITSQSFTMPAGDVTVTPVFVLKTYEIKLGKEDPFGYGDVEYEAKVYKNREETPYVVRPVPEAAYTVPGLTAAYGDTLTFAITAMDDWAGPVEQMTGAEYSKEQSTEEVWVFEAEIGNSFSSYQSYSIQIAKVYPVHFPDAIEGGAATRYRDGQPLELEAEASGGMQLRLEPEDGYYLKSLHYTVENPGDGWENWKEWPEQSKSYPDGYVWLLRAETWIYPEFESTKDLAERYECFGYDEEKKSVLISDEEGLFRLAELVNEGYDFYGATFKLAPEDGSKTIRLTKDWTPIGACGGSYSDILGFCGSFDGAGCTVSGMRITDSEKQSSDYGLFGYAQEGTIENLTVEGTIDLAYATSYVGGIAGRAKELRGCTGRVEIRLNHRASCVGGLVGRIGTYTYRNAGAFYDHYQNGVLHGCVNYGGITLDALGWTGRPLGDAGTKADPYGSYDYVGGIAGEIVGDTVEQCGNYGDISITENYQKQSSTFSSGAMHDHVGARAGGIIGSTELSKAQDGMTGSESILVKDCFNHGDILKHFLSGGGIVGISYCTRTTIENCYNTGRIEQTARGEEMPCPTVRFGGIVSCTNRGMQDYETDIIHCYSTTIPTCEHDYTWMGIGAICADDTPDEMVCDGETRITDCFGYDELSEENINSLLAVRNGAGEAAYVEYSGFAYPVLWWEQALMESSAETHSLAFSVTGEEGAEYTVKLYRGADRSDPVGTATKAAGTDAVFDGLAMGTYYYTVTSDGCVTESGIVTIIMKDAAVSVALRQACAAQFRISPADAGFRLLHNGDTVSPSGTQAYGGYAVYNYEGLPAGGVYTYTAAKEGCFSQAGNIRLERGNNGPFTVELEEAPLKITARIDPQHDGEEGYLEADADGYHIDTRGVYHIAPGTYGGARKVHIETTDQVTLLGDGAEDGSEACKEIYIACRDGVDLTLRDVYFYNKDTSGAQNMIDFAGSGNTLRFASLNVLDQDTGDSGCALIHAGPDTALTITGGTAYLYKSELGAAIGGNGGGSSLTAELWGKITIEGAALFIKGNKTGALIGSGADVGKNVTSANEILIEDSTLNLIATARGAAIGGGAGSSGGGGGAEKVTVKDSTVNIDVEYTGAAVGGGGSNEASSGNDASGGSLFPEHSSLRVYLLDNAVPYWKTGQHYYEPDEGGVTTAPITADVYANDGGSDPQPIAIDISGLSDEKYFGFTIYGGPEDGIPGDGSMKKLYTGTTKQHRYRVESGSGSGSSTMSNWLEEADTEIFLYLTPEEYQTYRTYKVQAGCRLCTLVKGSDGTYTVDPDSMEELHTYGNASYTWTEEDGGYTCTAELMCLACGERLAETVEAKGEITKKATAEEEGLMTYTASFTDSRFQEQTKTVSIPKLGTPPGQDDGTDKDDASSGQGGNSADETQLESGTKLTDTDTKNTYVVVKGGSTVMFTGTKKKNVTSLVIPARVEIRGVTYKVVGIDTRACKGNETLRKVTIKNNVITIGEAAFRGCTALKTVKIGNNVTTIGAKAFYGCGKLSSLTIGNSVATIGRGAFRNCVSVEKITIPVNVKKIGKNAFHNCKKVSTITVKTTNLTVSKIGKDAFKKTGSSNYKKLTVKVPKEKYAKYKKALQKKGLSSKVNIVKN